MTWKMLHLHPCAKKCTMHMGELGHHWIPASCSTASQHQTGLEGRQGAENIPLHSTTLTTATPPGSTAGQGHHPLTTLGKLFHLYTPLTGTGTNIYEGHILGKRLKQLDSSFLPRLPIPTWAQPTQLHQAFLSFTFFKSL